MSTPLRRRLLVAALAAVAATVGAVAVVPPSPASAHGNVVSPASRNYGCFERWGSRFQAPEMATEDPMCYQAWQANPNAMWNWNGLFRENVGGNHQAAIPDGQLCSGGRTEGGRYNAMDAVGAWRATPVGTSFTVRLFDGARHGADYVRVYVSRPGYDPTTQPLRWADLQPVGEVGNTPAGEWDPATNGVQIDIPVSVPGRTGRAVVYTIWQASHLDQSYYFCSDVTFGGTPDPDPTTPPPTTPPPTTPPPSTPPPSTPPPAGACTAAYTVVGQWQGGFQADVRVTAGAAPIRGWTVTMTFPDGQRVAQAWNATVTSSGATATARNVAYNGALGAGASATFGFLGSTAGSTGAPALTCAAT
jgi:lytic cellulose monooxygenase (C4-dehydrogenating)